LCAARVQEAYGAVQSMDIWKSSFCAIRNKKWLLLLLVLPVLASAPISVEYSFEDSIFSWFGKFYIEILKFAAIYAGVAWVLELGHSCTKAALFFSAITLFSIDVLLWLIGHVNLAFDVGQISWQGWHLLAVDKGDVTGGLIYVSALIAQQTIMFGLFMLLAMLIPPLLSFGRIKFWRSLRFGWLMRGFLAKGAIIGILPLWLLHAGAAVILPELLFDGLVWLGGAGENLYRLKGAALAVTVLLQFLIVLKNVMVGVILAQAFLRGSRRDSKAITASDM
jgi:hypothetical protein